MTAARSRFAVAAAASLVALAPAGAPPPAPVPAPATTAAPAAAAPLAWSQLEVWKNTLTEAQARAELDTRYAPGGVAAGLIELTPAALLARVRLAEPTEIIRLPLRAPDAAPPASPPGARYWRSRAVLGPAPAGRPLAGLRIALDPGHIGGAWAEMEERSFSVDGRPPVREGDLTLRVAQALAPRLAALGAEVSFVRDRAEPVTAQRPEQFLAQAEAAQAAAAPVVAPAPVDAQPPVADPAAARARLVRQLAELLFYRTAEIRARAERVNHTLRPDLVLCLHFNAAAWPDPERRQLVDAQDFHVLVNGAYSRAELENDEQRLAMLERLASGAGAEELAAARAFAEGAAPVFGLPPYRYTGTYAIALGGGGYVWGRNLLANRLYRCPVIFIEAYAMNSVEGYARLQAGEYEGAREFGGVPRKNMITEYADAVIAGLVRYYSPEK